VNPTVIDEIETAFGSETGLARYKLGKCSCCGKGMGEPQGLEYRSKVPDIYCHSCRKPWPLEIDVNQMHLELAIRRSGQNGRDMSAVVNVGERPPRVIKPRGFRALKGLFGFGDNNCRQNKEPVCSWELKAKD